MCEGNAPVTGEFPAQRASNAKIFPFDDVIMKWIAVIWLKKVGQQDSSPMNGHHEGKYLS